MGYEVKLKVSTNSKLLGLCASVFIGAALLCGCSKGKEQRAAALEEAIIKATGSSLVAFGEYSFFHGANFEAGMFLACDNKIYQDYKDGLLPDKKHPVEFIPNYQCKAATKESAVIPVFFFLNPPQSDAKRVDTSVTLQLKDVNDPTGKSDLTLASFQISNNSNYYIQNRHVLGPQIQPIPVLNFPVNYKSSGQVTFKAVVADNIQGRTIELAQAIEIEEEKL
jgi:hypothetical protein